MLTLRILTGADASHPGAGVRNQPSIASLVWSTNETATTYAAVSGVQDPGQEMIVSLESMLTARGSCGWRRSLFNLLRCSSLHWQVLWNLLVILPSVSSSFEMAFQVLNSKKLGQRRSKSSPVRHRAQVVLLLWRLLVPEVIKQHSKFWISRNLPPPLVTFVVVGKRYVASMCSGACVEAENVADIIFAFFRSKDGEVFWTPWINVDRWPNLTVVRTKKAMFKQAFSPKKVWKVHSIATTFYSPTEVSLEVCYTTTYFVDRHYMLNLLQLVGQVTTRCLRMTASRRCRICKRAFVYLKFEYWYTFCL